LHLRTAFFEAHLLSPSKIWQLWTLKSYKVLMETPYTIVTPYNVPNPISQCYNMIIEVLWLGILIMFQLRHHRETGCHSQPSVMTTWQISVGDGPHLTAAHSAR